MSDQRLGDYHLGEPVEVDTYAVSYRAHRDNLADRPLLIKTLKSELGARPTLTAALRHEAEFLQRIDHPKLTRLIDIVETPNRIGLVVLDHGGHRLSRILKSGERIETAPALAIAIEVTEAIAAIHAHKEVHGRIRANVVELTSHGAVCVHGHGIGTGKVGGDANKLELPEDMAPEQIVGDVQDEQTDIFLLGVLLYQMLSGQKPFTGQQVSTIAQRVRHEPPPPLQQKLPQLPTAVEKLVMRCLRKRPSDRFDNLDQLGSALIAALRAQTTLPRSRLVVQALTDTGMIGEHQLPGHRTRVGIRGYRPLVRPILWLSGLVAIAALIALVGWRSVVDHEPTNAAGPQGIVKRPAQLRVLARPWAEIYVDGKPVEITPVGRPLQVTPGKHQITLKHPDAPDETRTVELIAGQTILVDVTMNITRPVNSSAVDAGPKDDSP